MRPTLMSIVLVLCAWPLAANGQGIMSDMMSGKLVNPEVGAFAWYNLTDSATGRQFFLRQAIVGSERVGRKDAFWLETELVPKVGFPSVYKMLLTGPANDPDNVHRLIVREGQGAIQEVDVDRTAPPAESKAAPRSPVGTEVITLPEGEIEAEHFVLVEEGKKTELWVSEAVRPMGLVRMKSPEGELSLQRYGVGGKDGQSALPGLQPREETAEETQEPEVSEEPSKPKKSRRNFFGRRK